MTSTTLPRIRTLPDGTRVRIRQVVPEDREALAAAFERLSPQSRYERFMTYSPRFGDRELDYFTRVDHHDHEALGVELAGTGEGIAIARFVKVDATTAEPAIVVVDDWQGRGVARVLLDALVQRAREEGVERFVAHVLSGNHASLHAFGQLGETERSVEASEVELSIALPSPGEDPAPLLQALRATAAGGLRPGRTFWERVTWRSYPRTDAPRRAVVVALDESEHGETALRWAREIATARDAELHLVAALGPGSTERERRRAHLDGALAELRAAGLAAECHLRRGSPPSVILDLAAELRAELVVCAPHNPRTPVRLLLGGVSEQVAHRAPCDVLLVRPDEPWGA